MTLIGAPSAVAEPVTHDLLLNYETWLNAEVFRVARELHPGYPGAYSTFSTPAWAWHELDRKFASPSSRAALVLSTVGCDWREGGR